MLILLLLFAVPAMPVLATEEIEIPLSDGSDAFITAYPADGDALIVWFPSEFGPSPRHAAVAKELSSLGLAVWMPDLHATWFLPVGRYSLGDLDPGDLGLWLQMKELAKARVRERDRRARKPRMRAGPPSTSRRCRCHPQSGWRGLE